MSLSLSGCRRAAAPRCSSFDYTHGTGAGTRTPISDCPPHSTSELLLQLFQSVHRQALLRFVFSALPLNYFRYESLGRRGSYGALYPSIRFPYGDEVAIMDYTGLTNIPATLMLLVFGGDPLSRPLNNCGCSVRFICFLIIIWVFFNTKPSHYHVGHLLQVSSLIQRFS